MSLWCLNCGNRDRFERVVEEINTNLINDKGEHVETLTGDTKQTLDTSCHECGSSDLEDVSNEPGTVRPDGSKVIGSMRLPDTTVAGYKALHEAVQKAERLKITAGVTFATKIEAQLTEEVLRDMAEFKGRHGDPEAADVLEDVAEQVNHAIINREE